MTNSSPEGALPLFDDADPTDLFTLADRADWMLLRMVSCVAFATLLLAAASSWVG